MRKPKGPPQNHVCTLKVPPHGSTPGDSRTGGDRPTWSLYGPERELPWVPCNYRTVDADQMICHIIATHRMDLDRAVARVGKG